MEEALKRTLKRIPFVKPIYRRWRAWRDEAKARELFSNYEVYFRALAQKGVGTVALETRDGLSITIRQNIWDARIIKEIFIDKPYTRYFDLPANPTILDIGGYIGDFSIYAVKYLNADKVIVYEPIAENFAILKKNIENNHFEDRITAVNKAVSNSFEVQLNVEIQESEEVHVSAYWYQEAERRMIASVTLAEILTNHQLHSIDLLKVDCEGGEYDIFPTVSDEAFTRIRNIVFEHHRVDGFEEKLDTILNRLKSAGYTLRLAGQIAYAFRR